MVLHKTRWNVRHGHFEMLFEQLDPATTKLMGCGKNFAEPKIHWGELCPKSPQNRAQYIICIIYHIMQCLEKGATIIYIAFTQITNIPMVISLSLSYLHVKNVLPGVGGGGGEAMHVESNPAITNPSVKAKKFALAKISGAATMKHKWQENRPQTKNLLPRMHCSLWWGLCCINDS